MRARFSPLVCAVVCAVVGAACPAPPVILVDAGSADEGEGDTGAEGEGEGEGDIGAEGEGEVVRVDVPDRACVVVDVDGDPAGIVHPRALVRAQAQLPVARAEGGVHVAVLDSDTLAFVASRVGDVVFGDGADACFVHVAAFSGLTVELAWVDANVDADVALAAADDAGVYCVDGLVDFDVGVATSDIDADCSALRCSFETCAVGGPALADFDGDGDHDADDPSLLGDDSGPGVEHIVWARPHGTVLATGHSYDNGPAHVTLRAYLDDVLVGEARDRLESLESGAALLLQLDDDAVCRADAAAAADADADVSCAPAPFSCPAACAADCFVSDGGCRACECGDSALGCDHVDNACHVACRELGGDVDDVVYGDDRDVVLGAGTFANDVCPGDVDVFVIDAVAADEVFVQALPAGSVDVALADADGPLAAGVFAARAVVRTPPLTLTLTNHHHLSADGAGSVRVEIDAVADRCAVDDAVEPDVDTPRVGSTRGDGVLCPGDETDCIAVTPAEDRRYALDRLSADEADCLVDVDVDAAACVAAVDVDAGVSRVLCVRDTAARTGSDWHLRSTVR